MSVVSAPNEVPIAERAALPPMPVCRLTVHQYHRMIATGIIREDDRVELLKGWIVPKMGHNPPHSLAVNVGQAALRAALPGGWFVLVQLPITTGDSEPEPDLAVVRGGPRDYASRHPGPEDIGLLVEDADTSLDYDRHFKGPLYASASISSYWIVNLIQRRVEVYTDPSGPAENPGYRHRQDYGENESVPLVLDGVEAARIAVRDLLP